MKKFLKSFALKISSKRGKIGNRILLFFGVMYVLLGTLALLYVPIPDRLAWLALAALYVLMCFN